MNEKVTSALQKAQQERKRGQFPRAIKRLEQAIAAFPDELDLYLEAVDACLEGGEVMQATAFLKTAQEKFTRDRDRMLQFVREKLQTVHDPSLARFAVEHAVKRRDLEAAMALLDDVPDHTVRDLFNRAKTKMQSLKSATHGGYTLRGEMVSNELTNALLSVRLGNMKEAMATLVKIIEDKPVEHKVLDPFLAALEAKHAKSGRVRYARACSLRAAANEVEAIQRFVEASRMEPACAVVCAEQLRAMLDNPRHGTRVQRALAEVLLLKGDLDEAAAVLRDYLGAHPDNAREIIMLLRPVLDPANGLNACTWLAIETALSIEQSSLALEILRPLQQRGGHGAELYDWFETRSAGGFLPAEAMMFHGSLAIEQKQFARAAEILGAVCSTSPQDTQAVLAIIDRHRSAHPDLEALYQQHATVDEAGPESAADDESAFQVFENSEFRLESSAGFQPATSKSQAEKPKSQFAKPSPISRPSAAPAAGAEPARKPLNRKSLTDARELTLEDEPAPVPAADEGIAEEAAVKIEITEAHVANVAQQLYLAGAATFFHIEDDPEPASAGPIAAPARAPEAHEDTPAPEPDTSFESELARFQRGELDNPRVLALMERAVDEGRANELHDLLCFEPETGAEHLARYYFEAEYHALRNRPLQALEILARLDTPALGDNDRRRVWYKIAVCQRMTRNFAGANDTLVRLVEHFPDQPEYARLKRRNHEQFLAEQSCEAPALEKTSSLD